ncbi:hypothetical protein [Methylocella sp.]|uniref:hypothetical protein n=1 Tax=Methylocella sp. TaxID=1978226 RepID=UPI0035B0E07A
MRPHPQKVTLGAKAWTVRPLTLRQLQEIEPILTTGEGRGNVASALAILSAALRRDHPADVEALGDLEAGAPELAAAMNAVLRLGGFLPQEDGAAGERRPGETEPGEA